jgi:enterochelin esterase-like enzyme
MRKTGLYTILLCCIILFTGACKKPVKSQEDKIYSRHLQRHVTLTIVTTPMPDDKSTMNLLLCNNGNELEALNLKQIMDSLYDEKKILPLTIVGIHGNDATEYGMGELDLPGDKTDKPAKFNEFVMRELYPFIKKKTGIRSFRSIAICGTSRNGINAIDIAWNNADRIQKVGLFSGAFDYADKYRETGADSLTLVLDKLRVSRKRPKLQYWFYSANNTDSLPYQHTQQLIDILHKKNITGTGDIQFIADPSGTNDMASWRKQYPAFISWAFGK